jgi:multiple sugar transport system substrate-binding protein
MLTDVIRILVKSLIDTNSQTRTHLQSRSKMAIVNGAIVAAVVSLIAIQYLSGNSSSFRPGTSNLTKQEQSEVLSTFNDSQTLNSAQNKIVQKESVKLTAIFDGREDKAQWDKLVNAALERLEQRHPNLNFQIDYTLMGVYAKERAYMLNTLGNNTSVDLISIDQIWLGEFVERGLLTDLGDRARSWGRSSEWYQASWDGGVYNGKVYAIWAWTDVRGIWYWKDLLEQADVNPDSLKTWDGYISSAKKLNAALKDQGIQGVHLVGASHSPDMWYPYLWMLGGDILERKDGHPTKGNYWYPSFNSTEGVQALQFLKDQVDAGINPQVNHSWGSEFANRSFAVMIEGSWLPGRFPLEDQNSLEQRVGFIPMFPVPNQSVQSTTLMGGWLFAVPETSKNKDLAWELLTTMLEPDILTPIFSDYALLPTQLPIGEGQYSGQMKQSVPYYEEMVSMLNIGHKRLAIPEYPQIATYIKTAIDQVYSGQKEPKEAIDEAAQKSALLLGW